MTVFIGHTISAALASGTVVKIAEEIHNPDNPISPNVGDTVRFEHPNNGRSDVFTVTAATKVSLTLEDTNQTVLTLKIGGDSRVSLSWGADWTLT